MSRQYPDGAVPAGVRRRRRATPAALPVDFYARPSDAVARELLGCIIEREIDGVRCTAEIVEAEAYLGPHDEASHAAARFGRTPRNEVMFGPPGHAYVYLIYGMHWCMNAVTDVDGFPSGVLLRAAWPREGLQTMRGHRPGRSDEELLRGPGNLCRALGIDRSLYGHDLSRPPLRILPGSSIPDERVATGPRIGVTRAVDDPLRFWVRDCPAVSGSR